MVRKSVLTPFQKKIFQEIISNQYFQDKYYFSGGTALAEFYLHHRFSKDLDFFTDQEVSHQEILSLLKPKFDQMDIESFEYREQAAMKIFFFKNHGGQKIKVDFNYFPFKQLNKFKVFQGFKIDSLFDLTVNKINLILTRTNIRDYIDLYFIQKEKDYSWSVIIDGIKEKYSWKVDKLNLGSKFIKADKYHDYPEMIKNFDKNKMIDFFYNQAEILKKEVMV